MARGTQAFDYPVLIGDIGGTNARFALLADRESEPQHFPTVRTAEFPTIDAAIQSSILARTSTRPRSTLLAVAAPIDGDIVPLTNCDWVVRPRDMVDSLGLTDIVLLNDFEAQALAVVALGDKHLLRLGEGRQEPTASRVVLGPGTGLGVAGLVHAAGTWIPVPGEGGHVDMGPRNPRDNAVFPHLEPIEGRISAEQMLCGRGLVNIYRAIASADGRTPGLADPAAITAAALDGSDPVAVEAVGMFATCLGRLAGDLALIFMSRGGVYLTGGITPRILPALESGLFRAAFDDKAPHTALLKAMPVFVITHPLAALEGLAAFARTPGLFGIETRSRRWRAA